MVGVYGDYANNGIVDDADDGDDDHNDVDGDDDDDNKDDNAGSHCHWSLHLPTPVSYQTFATSRSQLRNISDFIQRPLKKWGCVLQIWSEIVTLDSGPLRCACQQK